VFTQFGNLGGTLKSLGEGNIGGTLKSLSGHSGGSGGGGGGLSGTLKTLGDVNSLGGTLKSLGNLGKEAVNIYNDFTGKERTKEKGGFSILGYNFDPSSFMPTRAYKRGYAPKVFREDEEFRPMTIRDTGCYVTSKVILIFCSS